MGFGKYTPNDAIAGDMGWKPANIRQWSNVFRHWARCSIMEHDRINFKVFKRSIKKANGRIKNWSYRICEMLQAQSLEAYCNFENNIITKHTILQIEQLMFDKYKLDWKNRVSAYSQGNKLRTYKFTVVYPIRNVISRWPIVHHQKGRCEDFDYYRSL